jgi:hypothetical protein
MHNRVFVVLLLATLGACGGNTEPTSFQTGTGASLEGPPRFHPPVADSGFYEPDGAYVAPGK